MASIADTAEHALQPNARVAGRFRIEAILGQGGMGAVYRVVDERTGRALALKQLRTGGRTDVTAALMVSQFEREYHTLCQLAHPSIIEVYDYGVDGRTVFYTMELLDGQDLRERGQLPWREACAVLRDVASSLAIMHSRRLLHRDISARNVRCTTKGRSKLIDFGAMAPMGLVKHVVGTAPFVPPEALQQQTLDGRSDLYALGVLAYWVLTRRYPYRAQALSELPKSWQTSPARVRLYDAEVPEALDHLVMELIELDRDARPVSAAEVMERLSGIAGLPLSELPEVSRAYLVAPTLIGREPPLLTVRTHLLRSMHGKGGSSFLIDGAEGTGRSRLLDACVLEAKLGGATVLRADASDSTEGPYGVAKALCAQLFEALPRAAHQSVRPWRSLLAHLLPELSLDAQPSVAPLTSMPPSRTSLPRELMAGAAYSMLPSYAPIASNPPPPGPTDASVAQDSHTLQSALRDFMLAITRDKHVVIAVDDVDTIDPASAALLGALAHGAKRRRLVLLLSARSNAPASAALSLLREIAQTIALEPFTKDQSEQLLRSVFGDAGRLPTLNERLFTLAGGNPRWTMALCERLVERGLARYEAGGWRLPFEIELGDLPQSLAEASLERIAALPEDARILAEALCLADPVLLDRDRYPVLIDRDSSRAYRAIEALMTAGLLVAHGDRYRVSQQGISAALRSRIDPARACELHGRLARAYEGCTDPWQVPYHLLLAGREHEGIDALLALRENPAVVASKVSADAFGMAAAVPERLGLPHSTRFRMRQSAIGLSTLHADFERFNQYAWTQLECAARDAGLRDYQELGDDICPEARMQAAQARALQRHEALPERERGLAPPEAAEQLQELAWFVAGMAGTAQELDLIERMPSLEPLFPMLPLLRGNALQLEYQRHMQSGRPHLAEKTSRELISWARQAHAKELDVGNSSVLHWELLHQGLFAAARGDSAALDWISEIENVPYHRAGARRVRMAYELMHGNVEAANALRRRAELFALEDGMASVLPGVSTRLELLVYSYTDDLIGAKRTMERLEPMAQRFPRWRATWQVARSQYLRIQGDLRGALDALTSALQATAPGRHIDWGLAATMHVMLLNLMDRSREAVEQGLTYIAQCEREQLLPTRLALLRMVGEGLMRTGRLAEALAMIEEHIALHEAQATRGLQLGLAYEARARLAIACNDEAGMRDYAQRCAQQYKSAGNPTLSTKYKGLMRAAESAGMSVTTAQYALDTLSQFGPVDTSHRTQLTDDTLSGRLLGCIDRKERAHEGLRLLLDVTGAAGGFLFDLEHGELSLLASIDEDAPSGGLLEALASCTQRNVVQDDPATSKEVPADDLATSMEVADEARATTSFIDRSGRHYEPIVLTHDQQPMLLAALRYETLERRVVRREVLTAMVEALRENEHARA